MVEGREITIKNIFSDTVKLIDILNQLASKIETYKSKIPVSLMDEVSDLCLALGSDLCMTQKELGEKDNDTSDDKEDNLYNIEML